MLDPNFDSKTNHVDLSTSQSTSSSALLSSIRVERQAREQKRKEDYAARIIQRIWRGRRVASDYREKLLLTLEKEESLGIVTEGRRAGGLVVLLKDGWSDRVREELVLVRWFDTVTKKDQNGIPVFVKLLDQRNEFAIILGLLVGRLLEMISLTPTKIQAAAALSSLETILDPKSYTALPTENAQRIKDTLVQSIQGKKWVERLVEALERLVIASAPKRKHPHLQPVTRLLTAPFALVQPTINSPLIPPLINHLLAVPSLPSVLPLASLTHLSTHLALFTLLLPAAAAAPEILQQGKLAEEISRTYFLANLATFGITGQMLARHGLQGASVWMSVIGRLLSSVGDGWGKWVEGIAEDDEDEDLRGIRNVTESESDEEEDNTPSLPPVRARSVRRRIPITPAVKNKLVTFATPAHISTLASHIINPSTRAPPTLLGDFAVFTLGLMSAFRGSPKWEGILDSLVIGVKGQALAKTVWRNGVRGKWGNSVNAAAWDTINENPATAPLLLLTQMYCHYLLLTPDDEFFSPSTNPFTTDEVLDLARIWRDLAFWGYMNGVCSDHPSTNLTLSKGRSRGTEEMRASFTRGVTRVVERNARRNFADPDFWVMKGPLDLRGFVEAAVFDDAELSSAITDEDTDMSGTSSSLPRWARNRQRFTKRQMAFISPRLGLLNNLPMAVPFQTRLEVFNRFVKTDRSRPNSVAFENRIKAKIRRSNIAQDGFDQLGNLGSSLKGRIYIKFIDEWGNREEGIDGGGLFKEFLTKLSQEVFDTNRGLWLVTDQNELYPNPHSYATEAHSLEWYRFIGQVLGKAIYEGMLVDASFADFFLAKWLGRQSYLDDLNSLDKELYKGLIILKNYPKPEELALTFAITEQEFGVATSVDLVPGGSEIAVTAENRHEYIQLVCKYKLDKQIAAQSRAFFNGLSDLVDAKWLRMFDQRELQQVLGGEETLIDIDDLRKHTNVDGFPNSDTPRLFWKVVNGFSQEERRALLRFVTSCSRPPLLGFGALEPQFGVKFNGDDTSRLPSASACFNLLKLPGYTTESALRAKLLQAINSGAGFDMS